MLSHIEFNKLSHLEFDMLSYLKFNKLSHLEFNQLSHLELACSLSVAVRMERMERFFHHLTGQWKKW